MLMAMMKITYNKQNRHFSISAITNQKSTIIN